MRIAGYKLTGWNLKQRNFKIQKDLCFVADLYKGINFLTNLLMLVSLWLWCHYQVLPRLVRTRLRWSQKLGWWSFPMADLPLIRIRIDPAQLFQIILIRYSLKISCKNARFVAEKGYFLAHIFLELVLTCTSAIYDSNSSFILNIRYNP